MLKNAPFYNRTIRKVVVAFGTMFNDLQLIRYDKSGTIEQQRFKVPLNYGPKEKYVTRLLSDPELLRSYASVVPRLSFEMVGISYDSTRKQITTLQNFAKSSTPGSLKTQYVPIPYSFEFTLSLYVRNTEDGTQILEQILPFFTPDFTVTVDFISEMNKTYDMPVILNNIDYSNEYEGDFSTTRLIVWTLNFTAKSYIFPPVKGGEDGTDGRKFIKSANTNYSLIDSSNNLSDVIITNVFTTPDPIDAEPDEPYGFTEVITVYPDTL